LAAGQIGRRPGPNIPLAHCVVDGNVTSDHINVLTYCIAAGLCEETQDEEVAAEQLAESIRGLEAQVEVTVP
jgi:hypothetical protein